MRSKHSVSRIILWTVGGIGLLVLLAYFGLGWLFSRPLSASEQARLQAAESRLGVMATAGVAETPKPPPPDAAPTTATQSASAPRAETPQEQCDRIFRELAEAITKASPSSWYKREGSSAQATLADKVNALVDFYRQGIMITEAVLTKYYRPQDRPMYIYLQYQIRTEPRAYNSDNYFDLNFPGSIQTYTWMRVIEPPTLGFQPAGNLWRYGVQDETLQSLAHSLGDYDKSKDMGEGGLPRLLVDFDPALFVPRQPKDLKARLVRQMNAALWLARTHYAYTSGPEKVEGWIGGDGTGFFLIDAFIYNYRVLMAKQEGRSYLDATSQWADYLSSHIGEVQSVQDLARLRKACFGNRSAYAKNYLDEIIQYELNARMTAAAIEMVKGMAIPQNPGSDSFFCDPYSGRPFKVRKRWAQAWTGQGNQRRLTKFGSLVFETDPAAHGEWDGNLPLPTRQFITLPENCPVFERIPEGP